MNLLGRQKTKFESPNFTTSVPMWTFLAPNVAIISKLSSNLVTCWSLSKFGKTAIELTSQEFQQRWQLNMHWHWFWGIKQWLYAFLRKVYENDIPYQQKLTSIQLDLSAINDVLHISLQCVPIIENKCPVTSLHHQKQTRSRYRSYKSNFKVEHLWTCFQFLCS